MIRSFLLLAVYSALAQAADFHVAPGGDDAAAGTADRPFATLSRAVEARRRTAPGEAVTLTLHDGMHILKEPLVLTASDSDTEESPLLIAAAPGAKPVVTGGRRLRGWTTRDGRWELEIPEVKRGDWNFMDLFVDGAGRPRARLPKQGWFKIAGELPPSVKGQGVDFGKPAVGDDQFA